MNILLTALEAGTEVATPSKMEDLITNLTTAVKGIYGLADAGFDFISNNVLCLLMVGLSFAGAGLGLVGRAFKTSRR